MSNPYELSAADLVKELDLDTANEENIQLYLAHIQALRRTVVLWMVALGLAILIFPFMFVFSQIRADVAANEVRFTDLQSRLAEATTPLPQTQALSEELSQTQHLAGALVAVQLPTGPDWTAVVAALDQYDPGKLALLSLVQKDNQLTLTGEAADNATVVGYAATLTDSAAFSKVDFQFIKLDTGPSSKPTPSATGESGAVVMPVTFSIALHLTGSQP